MKLWYIRDHFRLHAALRYIDAMVDVRRRITPYQEKAHTVNSYPVDKPNKVYIHGPEIYAKDTAHDFSRQRMCLPATPDAGG
jgi:hypothetical protein